MGREIGALGIMKYDHNLSLSNGARLRAREKRPPVKAFLILAIAAFLSSCSMQDDSANTQNDNRTYPTSNASYDEVNIQTGCDSKFIDQKRDDIFNSQYKDRWMTWEGKVYHAESESVSLDMNDMGIHELQADFSDPKAGYDTLIGSVIKVKFVLRSQGGCFLPFTGNMAELVK